MHRGNFDDHITASIPGYKDIQIIVGCAIAKTFWNGARLLDIGASEGSLAKAISSYTNGRVHSVVLDPSFAMREMFQGISTVAETTFVLAAFGRKVDEGELAWVEQDFFDREKKRPNPYAGMPVHFFRHKDEEPKFDIAHASMTFQFLSNERADQIERAKELLTSTGILIIEEKVITDRFVEFEDQKDKYKLQYFTSNDIEEKARVVLSGGMSRVKRVADGMNAKMIHVEVLERVLLENFNAIVQFWDCGNFKGYAASDNTRNLVRLVNNMISTTTEFSSVRTPKYLKPNAIMRLLSKMSVK